MIWFSLSKFTWGHDKIEYESSNYNSDFIIFVEVSVPTCSPILIASFLISIIIFCTREEGQVID